MTCRMMRNTAYAAILATALGACASLPPQRSYTSIDEVIASPAHYNGCELTVEGRPRMLGMSFPGDGTMFVEFEITSGSRKAMRGKGFVDRKIGDDLRVAFTGERRYVITGTYDGSYLRVKSAEREGRRYDFRT